MQATTTTYGGNSAASGNKIFALPRFMAYFRLYTKSNSRKLLLSAGLIFIATFSIFLLNFYFISDDRYETLADTPVPGFEGYDLMWSGCNMIISFVFVLFASMAGSMMYSSVASRRQRLVTLQIPATQLEKFLTWWIICVPVFIICSFAAFYLAEILRVLWIKMFSAYGSQAHIMPLKYMFAMQSTDPVSHASFTNTDLFLTGLTYGFVLLTNALFSLGSIVFHKMSYLKTFITLFIWTIVCGILINVGYIVLFHADPVTSAIDTNKLSATIWSAAIQLAICAYFYWLGYRRYKETNVIDRW